MVRNLMRTEFVPEAADLVIDVLGR